MNAVPGKVLVDQRWLDHQGMTHLYHPTCVDRIAKFYKMRNPSLRYRPYTGHVAEGATCDLCKKSLLWALADHMTPKEA